MPNLIQVALSSEWHAALTRLAANRAMTTGKRETIRGLVEAALKAMYGANPAAVSAAANRDAAGLKGPEEALREIVHAAASGGNSEIDALTGIWPGSTGAEIRLRDLAYHLRGQSAADQEAVMAGGIAVLIESYEKG